jgi:(5-formylfuran-3-yl)methyl phosphate synthase
MTLFLVSVRDEAEAEIAFGARADIIDLKEPAHGALGAVGHDRTRAILSAIAGRATVSATIGDLPMVADTIRHAVLACAALGVDYVKFGLFPDGNAQACLEELRPVARSARLIVVVFADRLPQFDAVAAAADMGAAGIMLDTAGKSSGSLRDHVDLRTLAQFVTRAKAQGLGVGLAGSLSALDVPKLLALGPDLLGFRGALCHASRSSSLNPLACAAIRALIPEASAASLSPAAKLHGAVAAASCWGSGALA